MPNRYSVEFKHVTFKYRTQAKPTLYDINLKIKPGEKVLIAGPSGSGKSTLGRMINGLIPHAYKGDIKGQVLVNGHDAPKQSIFDLSKQIGTVLQDSDNQFVGLNTAEDIAFGLENDQTPVVKMRREVKKWARTLGIAKLLKHSPQQLSGGQKQRTSMAGVMADRSRILLFDEPLAALDPAAGHSSMQLINDLNKKYHTTTIIIEHRLEDVLTQPIDRIVLLKNGRIVANEKPSEVLKKDLLPKLKIRTPSYLSAIRLSGIPLNSVQHIDDVHTVTAPDMKAKLAKFDRPVPKDSGKGSTSGKPLLQIKNLNFSYGPHQEIFHHLNLTVNKGDRIALVGRNGVGKTTLSKLIIGFLKPQAGHIMFNGRDLTDNSIKERADHIGYVMQDPDKMISQVMIKDEIKLGLKLRSYDQKTATARMIQALKVCGLYPYRNWPVSALSYGQKKRVTIASILVLRPDIIILDEPTAGQDWYHYMKMMKFLKQLNQQGVTLIFITHNIHLMLEYANRAVVLGNYGILMDGQPYSVLNNHHVVKEAHLAHTSLYYLAKRFHFRPDDFTANVIRKEVSDRHE